MRESEEEREGGGEGRRKLAGVLGGQGQRSCYADRMAKVTTMATAAVQCAICMKSQHFYFNITR